MNISKLTLAGALGFGIASSIWGLALAATATQPEVVALNGTTTSCPVGQPDGPTPPRANPRELAADESTQLTVTSVVPPGPSLVPNSVTLLQVDSSGNVIANLGQMYDDGTHGDTQANDGMYTAQPTFNPASAGQIYLRAQASYSGPPGCRQSNNNDWDIVVSNPRITASQMQAEDNVESAEANFYDSEVARVGPVQAKQDLINFLLSNFGPNGTVNPGVVVSAGLSPDGSAVWWTYNDGTTAGQGDADPSVGGLRTSSKNTGKASTSRNTVAPARGKP